LELSSCNVPVPPATAQEKHSVVHGSRAATLMPQLLPRVSVDPYFFFFSGLLASFAGTLPFRKSPLFCGWGWLLEKPHLGIGRPDPLSHGSFGTSPHPRYGNLSSFGRFSPIPPDLSSRFRFSS